MVSNPIFYEHTKHIKVMPLHSRTSRQCWTDTESLALGSISWDNGPKCMKMNCPQTIDDIEDSLHTYIENTT